MKFFPNLTKPKRAVNRAKSGRRNLEKFTWRLFRINRCFGSSILSICCTTTDGYRAVHNNHLFKKSPKHGVKSSSLQLFIQKKPKTQDKKQFTAIVHSK
jgi:hypothetical protein